MALPKPTSLLPWTVGNPNFGTVTQEPSAGKKLTGFTANERPAPEYFNWLFYIIGQWIQYFSEQGALQANAQYQAIVASLANGGSHTTLALALADANVPPFSRIYVKDGYSVNAVTQITKNGVRIEFAPGATITQAGSSNPALQISANDVRLENARFANFGTAIQIDVGSLRSRILHCNFSGCTTNISDLESATGVIMGDITE